MKNNKSFTLIEMIAVIAIVSLALPAIFAIIFGILRGQSRIQRLSTVKSEGDYILNVVSNTVKNYGLTIHSAIPQSDNAVCASALSTHPGPLYLMDMEGEYFGFALQNGYVSSSSSHLAAAVPLNSGQTAVTDFSFSCSRQAIYTAPVITISFTICYNAGDGTCQTGRVEDTAQLRYQTKIKLRNF